MTTQAITAKARAWLANSQVWGFFVSVAVMAAVSLAFFAPDVFEGNTLQQHDMQQGAANGEEARAYYEQTGEKALWTNALFSGMPTFQISPTYPSNSLFSWLNTVYGLGLPSPSNLLFMMMLGMLIMCYCCRLRWWYALIAAVAWGLSTYFVIIIGAGHIWKFLALTYTPPMIGGIIMAYRGRRLAGMAIAALFGMMQLNANHPQITYYALFIIAALVIAYFVGAILRHRLASWLKATAVCALAGALALGANSPALYNTYEYSKETKRTGSVLAAEKADGDAADRPTGGLPKAEIGGWSNTPSESFSLLVPNIKGGASIRPEKGQNTGLWLSDLDMYVDNDSMQYDDQIGLIPQLTQYFGGKGMTNGPFYFGALVVALALLGFLIVRGPIKWALLAVSLFSILLAMGNHFELLTDFMIYNFPMYNKFRAAETALVIAALCMPLMAALGLQKLLSTPNALRRYRIRLCIAFGVPALIAALAWLIPGAFGAPFAPDEAEQLEQLRQNIAATYPQAMPAFLTTMDNIETLRYSLVSADGGRSLLIIVLGAGAILAACRWPRYRTAGIVAVGVIVLADMFSVDKRYISHDSFSEPENTVEAALAAPDAIDQAILADNDYFRVADLTDFGGHRRSYFHHMVGGYHAAKLNRYNDLIDHRMAAARAVRQYVPEVRVDSLVQMAPPQQHQLMMQLRADYRVLDMLNTRYIITPQGLTVNTCALGPGWLVRNVRFVDGPQAEMKALETLDPATEAVADRQFADVLGSSVPSAVPGDTVQLVRYTPNTVEYNVTAKNGGVAVFSEVWFPWGWKATIDGQPAELARVNYVLRAMRIPAGTHTVSMTFNPDSLRVTGTVAYICVTLIYLLVLCALFVAFTPGILRRRR